MSKRRRKRRPRRPPPKARSQTAPAPTNAPSKRSATRSPGAHRPRRGGAREKGPPAPWGSFPLVELVVLTAIVLLIAGLVLGGNRGGVMIGTGLVLGSLGGLELSIREHFAGFRSHTLLLAGFTAAVVLGFLFYLAPAGLPPIARLAIGVVVFGVVARGLTAAFRRRSGVAFKIRRERTRG